VDFASDLATVGNHLRTAMPTKIEALTQLSRAEPTYEHFHEFFSQVAEEKNERGAALMLAANVEMALLHVVRRCLVIKKGQYKQLFGFESPMGTFSARIRIGYALDIFGPQTKDNLDYIRAIRNAFAHAVIPITFATAAVSDVCKMLVMPEILPPRAIKSSTGELVGAMPPDPSPRTQFQKVCEATGHNLFVWDWSVSSSPVHNPPSERHVVKVMPLPLP
jgi:hypothetical protein